MEVTFREIQESEIPEFKQLAKDEIGKHYADIDDSFAENISRAHRRDRDPYGYFTKTKTIWVGEDGGETVGYIVGTEKRGGCVKISPILVKEPCRQQGYGTALWNKAESHYRDEGHRKLYTHAPLYRDELYKWFSDLGAHLEAILREQYDTGQDEFIMGKMLDNPEQGNIPVENGFMTTDIDFEVSELIPDYESGFRSLILGEMTRWYGEIDDEFVTGIIDAQERIDEGYRKKGKVVYIVATDEEICGCCVATPKRGGSVKLVPLLFGNNGTAEMVKELLQRIYEDFKETHRKLYIMLPHLQTELLKLLRGEGFQVEGFLREPYKPGIDNIFLGKFIKEGR
ncbi:GNAT family N-acetyltransferase [Haloplanus natans]|uniref:GNAT family N-acetyltransferase n=1 Tax=Haloplanus natans TaxID=376171 RepID=UPI00067782EF|nr:GNAT family N-acetyltransferase [Haloplanus natans]